MTDFTMPSLGADMEEATFVEWKVAPGDVVKRGDVVCVIETQKGAVDVEIWEGGTVAQLVAVPGQVIPVGGVLARLDGDDAAPEGHVARGPAPPAVAVPSESPAALPVSGSRRAVSPAARRRADELGVALATVPGTGPGGVITLEDVERAASSHAGAKPDTKLDTKPDAVPGAAMRAAIAAAMTRAKREIPHYYLGHEIRIDAAEAWLTGYNASRPIGGRVLFAAVALKAVAMALREAPELNGHFAEGTFRPGAGVHVGVAIALRGGGLVAPALHDADRLALPELMAGLKDLIQRARGGQLRSSELADATVTVTSLGDLGVDTVYGVIHPPQVALVGLGKPGRRPWADEERVIVARTLHATLSADHRASDGLAGARFLAALDRVFQTPEALA